MLQLWMSLHKTSCRSSFWPQAVCCDAGDQGPAVYAQPFAPVGLLGICQCQCRWLQPQLARRAPRGWPLQHSAAPAHVKKCVGLRSVKQWCAVAQGPVSKVLMHLRQRPGMCSQATASSLYSTLQLVTMVVSWHCMQICFTEHTVPARWLTAWAHHHLHLV